MARGPGYGGSRQIQSIPTGGLGKAEAAGDWPHAGGETCGREGGLVRGPATAGGETDHNRRPW